MNSSSQRHQVLLNNHLQWVFFSLACVFSTHWMWLFGHGNSHSNRTLKISNCTEFILLFDSHGFLINHVYKNEWNKSRPHFQITASSGTRKMHKHTHSYTYTHIERRGKKEHLIKHNHFVYSLVYAAGHFQSIIKADNKRFSPIWSKNVYEEKKKCLDNGMHVVRLLCVWL